MAISNPTLIIGTANQVLANGNVGTLEAGLITLTLPQSIGATSTPTFLNLTLTSLTTNTMLYSGTAGLLTSAGAATNGQVLIGSTGAAPVRAALAPSTGILITNGAGSITIGLNTTGIAGTYRSVTTDIYGRVTAGTNSTTIAGYGITDAQPLDDDLTALANSGGTGFYIRTGNGISVTRAFVAPLAGITITNPDGVADAPTLVLANDLAAVEGLATNGLAVRTGIDTWATRSLVAPAAGLTITNNTAIAGNPTFVLANDLAAVEGLATTGFAVRTGTDTWATRSLVSTTLTLANVDGIAGNPTINLASVGIAGTYRSVTTDTQGRVTAGINPTTLAGYGITDAQPLDSDLTALANTTTTGLYAVTAIGTSTTRTLIAASTKVAITNGSGVAGNPTIDVTEANLALNNISGTLSIAKGGTNLTAIGTANQILSVNAGAAALEYKTLVASSGIIIVQGVGTTTISAALTLDNLTDVTATAPIIGQSLNWNGTAWVPAGGAGVGGGLRSWGTNIAPQSGTSVILPSTTIPLITAGTELFTQTISPLSTSSKFTVQVALSAAASTNNNVHTCTVFRDSTYIGAAIQTFSSGGASASLTVTLNDVPNTTSPVTYSIRYGTNAGTWYVNRRSTEITYGGANSGVQILEF